MTMVISFDFVEMGYVAKPERGKVYVDVGNAFCAGVLDHHHPDAPETCTAMLALKHPEFIRSQIEDSHLTIICHERPDIDAITGAYFAQLHAFGKAVGFAHTQWAEYICLIDQGHTTLSPDQPVTPYSLFMMLMQIVRKTNDTDRAALNHRMLRSGIQFLDTIFSWLEAGGCLSEPEDLTLLPMFEHEVSAIQADLIAYRRDLERAERFRCNLPLVDGSGKEEVAGLWIEMPTSAMFKSWARGDCASTNAKRGFTFLCIRISDHRFILSVDPSSPVYLKGLGQNLEEAETVKRKKLGMPREGINRPGYNSPDPWYDGRSPLHNYSIIDSPNSGTILTKSEVRQIVCEFANTHGLMEFTL